MKVVVIGMGQVGLHVVGALEQEGHDVLAVDRNSEVLAELEQARDVGVFQGHGGSRKLLEQVGAGGADLVVAVTNNDEVNIVAGLIARELGAARTIVRVQAAHNSEPGSGIRRGMLGLDVTLNPRVLVAEEMARIARSHGALDVLGLLGDRVELVAVELPGDSRVLHKPLAQLQLPTQTLVAAVVRDRELFVPGGADVLLPGDRCWLLGRAGKLEPVQDRFCGGREAARVAVVGGGVIGNLLAQALAKSGIDTLLIEQNRKRAEQLAADLPDTVVLHGDGTDTGLLEEERVAEYDLFCAVTELDEVNLMAALMAKRLGVRRTISLVHRPDYLEIYRTLGIDVALSPRLVACDHILRQVRRGQLKALTVLEDGQAEVLEFVAATSSRMTGTPLLRLNLPRGCIIGAIVKGSQVIVPRGSDVIEPGDAVLVLTTKAARPAVERLFQKRSL
jgi:trk system potassium uptake protein TrkA